MKMMTMLCLGLLLSAPVLANTEKDLRRLAQARQLAGEPVRSVQVTRTWSWESLGEENLLLWTGPSRVFLLKLDGYCHDLGSASAIELDYHPPMFSAGFDSIRVRGIGPMLRQKCRVLEIRPVDAPAMKAADREARRAAKAK